MHAIVSVLEAEPYAKVESIWNDLHQRFGISGVRVTPIPHFSWQVASEYEFDQVERLLREVAESTPSFEVESVGVRMFGGPSPVIFIHIPRTAELDGLHARLWNLLHPHRRGESFYYSPDEWVPHVTLAEKDVPPDSASAVREYLDGLSLRWRIRVSNLAVIYQPAGSVGSLRCSVPLTANSW